MKRSSGPRKTANLSESIHQQLNMYAFAAGAGGLGALALTLPAEARIVYTPAHKSIVAGAPPMTLDLNHDHIGDFRLYHTSGRTSSSHYENMVVESYRYRFGSRNLVAAKPVPTGYNARALRAGVSIGPAIKFPKTRIALMGRRQSNTVNGTTHFSGPWANGGKGVKNRYLGLKFYISGKVHYGWARLTVTVANGKFFTETLTGYAYETIPNKSITTGQTKGPDNNSIEGPNAALTMPTPDPATLGALAMGSPGLSIWRRKESALQGN
jgi:hypothetical protein